MIVDQRISHLIGVLALPCGGSFWTPGPAPSRLAAEDARRGYVGQWRVDFALDSLREASKPGTGLKWVSPPATAPRVTGELEVLDSLLGRDGRTLAAALDIIFRALLGRPMSCFRPGSGLEVVEERGETILGFTPGAFDCGFSAKVRCSGNAVSGTWNEWSLAGPVATGRMWMYRLSPRPGGPQCTAPGKGGSSVTSTKANG